MDRLPIADAVAVCGSALAAMCGAAVLLGTLVNEPFIVLYVLVFYNVFVAASVAGGVLTAHTVNRAYETGDVNRARVAVGSVLLLPGLLIAAYIGADNDSAEASAALALGVTGAVSAVAAILLCGVSAGRAGRRGSRGRSASGSPRSPGTPS